MKYQFVYLMWSPYVEINWIPYVEIAGWAKETLPGSSLKYLFVYFKVLVFICYFRNIYIYNSIYII